MTTLTVGDSSYVGFEAFSNGYTFVTLATAPAAGTLTEVKFNTQGAAGSAVVTGVLYTSAASLPTSRLAMTATVTGVTSGVNVLTLTAPFAVTNGLSLFVGLHLTGAAISIRGTLSTGTNRFWADAAYPPDNPAPSTFSYANRFCMWAEGTVAGGTRTSVVWVGAL